MILDTILQACTAVGESALNALPGLNVNLDTAAIGATMSELQALDNWLPIHELSQVIGIMITFWGALQGFRMALKAWEEIKP